MLLLSPCASLSMLLTDLISLELGIGNLFSNLHLIGSGLSRVTDGVRGLLDGELVVVGEGLMHGLRTVSGMELGGKGGWRHSERRGSGRHQI